MSAGGLKSTYKGPEAQAPLLPGWTEHKAPSGHLYYYNADTKESTYKRPGQPIVEAPQPQTTYPNLSDPKAANAYLAQFQQPSHWNHDGSQSHGGRGGRGGAQTRPRPQPIDKPRRKEVIPGCEPWILIYTKYSRRFVYNPEKNASYWRIPEKLMPGILELDKARIRGKAAEQEQGEDGRKEGPSKDGKDADQSPPVAPAQGADHLDGDSSEYEEVEVTDDEAGDGNDEDGEHASKRQRMAEYEEEDEGPVEFTEADIAAQLQAMGDDYGLEPGDYDDGNVEDWPEGAEGMAFSEEDAKLLFKDLLNDYNINPYSPWDKLIEEGKVMDDPRYTALTTTRSRKECWDEWSRERIAVLKEQRARQEKTDPRVPFMAFLQEKATPKLYWAEFKRKHRKEPAMRDAHGFGDKDREKAYRDHIARLKQPQATRKADLTALLKAQPARLLNGASLVKGLPTTVLVDARYAALEPSVRDPLVEAYVQTLPPPAEDEDGQGKDEEAEAEARSRKERRERALAERDRAVEEKRREREREVARSKARLRDGEREVEVAMRVGKGGLRSQLLNEGEDKRQDDS